ncbi:DUF397 domain-containing protein [Streptomyces sp. NPDC058274]|uniref:DUF397 domain-containing protein n=1 Tax=Streptomyces sp. NPDC058274 TaxID=3346416 RepID=UPI0036E0423A
MSSAEWFPYASAFIGTRRPPSIGGKEWERVSPSSTALARHKSSYSGNHEATCVETARLDVRVGVRDSKGRQGPVLLFSHGAWGGSSPVGRRSGTPAERRRTRVTVRRCRTGRVPAV